MLSLAIIGCLVAFGEWEDILDLFGLTSVEQKGNIFWYENLFLLASKDIHGSKTTLEFPALV